MVEVTWLAIAFILGFAARLVGLPPLVGFLVAGFILSATGAEPTDDFRLIADLGVTLLLFTIGLKLRVGDLLKREVSGTASIHMLITTVGLGAVIFGLSAIGLFEFANLDVNQCLLIGFALSFSSTVFAVKVLEENGDTASLQGRTAVGVLIMQDLFAVLFLVVATGKTPSPWALALIPGLLIARPLLMILLGRVGHGELLVLMGILLTVGGFASFELVDLKGDLGALVAGMLIASHPKASELSKTLIGFKDVFLVAFFLSIGMIGAPTLTEGGVAVLLLGAVPLKVALFFALFVSFRLRSRTALRGSFVLANYSEFGLIVAYIGAANGWIDESWLIIIAVALALTFVLASPLNTKADRIYTRNTSWFKRFQRTEHHIEEVPIDLGGAEILVIGMGRIGTGAYEEFVARAGDIVVGVDWSASVVGNHVQAGRCVILADATNPDFARRLRIGSCRLVVLTLPTKASNLIVAQRLAEHDCPGRTVALAGFDDEATALKDAGVDAAFNAFGEAGAGLAANALSELDDDGRE